MEDGRGGGEALMCGIAGKLYFHRTREVEPEILAKHGAVSQQTAAAMARGVRQRAGADVGLAITGIAGPSGATATKPVGLVYLGLAIQSRTRTARLLFHGDRRSIKEQACQAALDWLRRSV